MNILMLSNIDDDEKLEDIWLTRAFQEDGHKVCITGIDYDEKLDEIFDIFMKRNVWFSDKSRMREYYRKAEATNQRLKQKNLLRINFDGKFDAINKTYLVELFKQGYQVVPTVDDLKDLELLPDVDWYLLKPKLGMDGIGQVKVRKKQLEEKFESGYVIQPWMKIKSEVQFYFIKNEFQYALEFKPSKVPQYPMAQRYEENEEELELAKTFAKLNQNFWGIQRIDFLKLENSDLQLIEIEDDSPYLDLDCVEEKTREKFLQNYKKMVYEYLKSK